MKREIDPLIIRLRPRSDIDRWGRIILKLKASDIPASLSQVERVWGKFSPDQPFVYSFLNTEINQFYRIDIQLGRILNGFSLLAILIACLGLFGLASFMAEQRTKEIGIRKVLGASVPGLIRLLCKDYLLLVEIAFIFAAPVSYIIMNRWLNEFAYRVDVSWEALLFVGAGALLVALVTVSYQSVKAALANPVQSLRYE
jgi:putative ABC transport system permease protein